MKIKFDWEKIAPHVYRSKVIGGWILQCEDPIGTVFIPDQNHEWEIDK